jgi:predicted dienelactone hydrolase
LPQLGPKHFQRSNASYHEPRIKAAVAIAAGFTESMTLASLTALKTPVLLLAAAQDQQLPPASHIYPVKALLPPLMPYVELADSHHFSLLPLCNEKAASVLAESDEEFVCEEVGGKTRAQIHAEALLQIRQFLLQVRLMR